MKWLRNRFLLLPYLALLIALVTVGCTSKLDPDETLDLTGNHSTGDLWMVTTDTSSDGFYYLLPQLSPSGQTVLFSADWWAIPNGKDPGDADYAVHRQMVTVPYEEKLEPKASLTDGGGVLILLQEISIPIGGSDAVFNEIDNMDKGNPIWEDETHIIFWLDTERVGTRLFRADISNPAVAQVQVLFMEPADAFSSPPIVQHMAGTLSPDGRWLAFTRSECTVPSDYSTCSGNAIYILDLNTAVVNNGYDCDYYALTNEYSRIETPKWHPDGSKILFSGGLDVGGAGAGAGTELFTIDIDYDALEAGDPPLDNNLTRLTYTSLAEGDPIAGVVNYGGVYSIDETEIYFVSSRRAPTTTLHDRNIWVIPAAGEQEPEIYYFSRDDDVDPFVMPDGRLLFSSALGFPKEMLDVLEEEAYNTWVVRNEEEGLGLDEVQMRELASDEIRSLEFFEGVMSMLYTFSK